MGGAAVTLAEAIEAALAATAKGKRWFRVRRVKSQRRVGHLHSPRNQAQQDVDLLELIAGISFREPPKADPLQRVGHDFCNRDALDLPPKQLDQLSSRVMHALRAFAIKGRRRVWRPPPSAPNHR